MKRIVFISHSSADRAIAERACAYLEKNGVGCWMAPRDVTPGKNYGAAIVDAIDECRVFVLILSSHSNKSRQVVREVERAASTDSVILPFRIEDVQPSRDIAFYVSAAHWLDAANYPVDEQFDELLTAIQNWQKAEVGGEPVAGTVPPPAPPLPTPQPAAPAPIPIARTRKRFPWLFLAIAAAVVVVAAIAGALIYKQSLPAPPEVVSPTAAPATPSPTISPVPSSPEPSATVTEASPIESPTPEETPTPASSPAVTPLRLKPGERLRPNVTPPGETALNNAPPPSIAPSAPGLKQPIVQEVAASSQLNKEYRPHLAFDGNPSTAWVPKGRAIEQSLFVHFKSPAVIQSVSILNGDGRDEEHYKESNRVRSLRIVLSDGTNQLLTFKDEMKMQRFELPKPVTASWVKFEIVSIFPGKNKRTGISEIAFNETGP